MTDDMMALRGLLEKSSDADLPREMIGFTARRLMALEGGETIRASGGHRDGALAHQSGRKFASTFPATRQGDGGIPKSRHATEIRRRPGLGSQPLQPRTPPLQPQEFQAHSLRRPRRLARTFRGPGCAGWPIFGEPFVLV